MRKYLMAVDSLTNSFSMIDCLSNVNLKYSSDNNPEICKNFSVGDIVFLYYKNDINSINTELSVVKNTDDGVVLKKAFEFSNGIEIDDAMKDAINNNDVIELSDEQYKLMRRQLFTNNFNFEDGSSSTLVFLHQDINEANFVEWLYNQDFSEDSKHSIIFILKSLPSAVGAKEVFQVKTLAEFDEYRNAIEENPFYKKTSHSVGKNAPSQALTNYRRYLEHCSLLECKLLIKELVEWSKKESKDLSIQQVLIGFGLRFGNEIIKQKIKLSDLVAGAGIDLQNAVYLEEGVNLYKAIEEGSIGLSIEEKQYTVKKIDFNTKLIHKKVQNRIVFGAPGTGKSFKLDEEKKVLLKDGGYCERVTFHPDYSYANFVGTYKPVPDMDDEGNKTITYEYVPGPFMSVLVKALKNAMTDTPKPHLLLIEEINRANVAAVFGEVFQLLDRNAEGYSEYAIAPSKDMRDYIAGQLELNPDDITEIRIPNNMYIWATMNSADQGVFPMDTAFKRRWDFEYIGIDDGEEEPGVKEILEKANFEINGDLIIWNKLRKAINKHLTSLNVNEDKLMGPFFINLDFLKSADNEALIKMFKSKVLMYLFEDAAKQKRKDFFAPKDELKRCSGVCDEFEKHGIEIFKDYKDKDKGYEDAIVKEDSTNT